jgi:glycosyltransferase involved in cell wall biosynthesis
MGTGTPPYHHKGPVDHTWLIPYGGEGRSIMSLISTVTCCGQVTPLNRIIVVDDSGRDELKDGVGVPGVKIYKNDGSIHGCAKALNIGLTYVETTWIWRMDADDTPTAGHNRMDSCRVADENVVLLAGEMKSNYDKHMILNWQTDTIRQLLVIHRNPIYHPATCLRTKAVNDAGGWPEDCGKAEDYGLWAALIGLGSFVPVRNVWTNYTMGPPHHRQQLIDEVALRMGW